jgi:glycosyltransferase involved in cell wall biosynthesis
MSDRKIKLTHVVGNLSLHGMEYGVIKLLNNLSSDRYESTIVVINKIYPRAREKVNGNINLVELNKDKGFDVGLIFKLVRIVSNLNTDILHDHNWSTYPYVSIAKLFLPRVKFIHGEHGRETPELKLSLKQKVLISITKHLVSKFTTVADHLAVDLKNIWHIKSTKIVTIHNGIDLDLYEINENQDEIRESIGVDNGDFVVGTIAGIREIKDHITIFKAIESASNEIKNLSLVVIGSTPDKKYLEYIESSASKICVNSNVVFLGQRKDVPRLIKSFNVYVNSSLFEGMSNTIMESMASDCAVIASNNKGNLELLLNGRMGNIFPMSKHEKITEILLSLYHDDSKMKELIENQKEHLINNFTMNILIEKYDKFYNNILNK